MRWAFVAVLAFGCDQGAPAANVPSTVPAIVPETQDEPCTPLSDDRTYTVCVIDEAGNPVRGATVTATQQMRSLNDDRVYENTVGQRVTDSHGRAQFSVRTTSGDHGWSAYEIGRTAVGQFAGWPRETANESGFIVVGPLRSFQVRRTFKGCHRSAWISAVDPQARMVLTSFDRVRATYSVSVGPGTFTIDIVNCAQDRDAITRYAFVGKDVPSTGIDL